VIDIDYHGHRKKHNLVISIYGFKHRTFKGSVRANTLDERIIYNLKSKNYRDTHDKDNQQTTFLTEIRGAINLVNEKIEGDFVIDRSREGCGVSFI